MFFRVLIILFLACTPATAQVQDIEGRSQPYLNQQLRDTVRRLNFIENYTINSLPGVLQASKGGTGEALTGHTKGSLWYDDGSDFFVRLGQGSDGQHLRSKGAGVIPIWENIADLSNLIFVWTGNDDDYAADNTHVLYRGTSLVPNIGSETANYFFIGVYENTYRTVLETKYVHLNGVTSVTIHAKLWSSSADANKEAQLSVNIGGNTNTVNSTTSTSPSWVTTSNIDVSGLTVGTTYTVVISLRNESTGQSAYCSAVALTTS